MAPMSQNGVADVSRINDGAAPEGETRDASGNAPGPQRATVRSSLPSAVTSPIVLQDVTGLWGVTWVTSHGSTGPALSEMPIRISVRDDSVSAPASGLTSPSACDAPSAVFSTQRKPRRGWGHAGSAPGRAALRFRWAGLIQDPPRDTRSRPVAGPVGSFMGVVV